MTDPISNLNMPGRYELLGNLIDGDVMELFFIYSRFEYALKCIRKYRGSGHGGSIKPELYKYAKKDGKIALSKAGSAQVEKAVKTLNDAPPKIQKSDLRWHDNPCTNKDRYERAIIFAKDVRNNLFHGGKSQPVGLPNQYDRTRDNAVILAAITIIKGCLVGDAQLRRFFGASLGDSSS